MELWSHGEVWETGRNQGPPSPRCLPDVSDPVTVRCRFGSHVLSGAIRGPHTLGQPAPDYSTHTSKSARALRAESCPPCSGLTSHGGHFIREAPTLAPLTRGLDRGHAEV